MAERAVEEFSRRTVDAAPCQCSQLLGQAGVPGTPHGKAGIRHPARPTDDLDKLLKKGVKVFALREDLEARGIATADCLPGVRMIKVGDLPDLLEKYDQVWHW